MRWWMFALCLVSCGRIGFDAPSDASDAITATPDAACSSQPELCNGIDDNCNGEVDEGCPCTPFDVTLPLGEGGLVWLGDRYAMFTNNSGTTALTIVDTTGAITGSYAFPDNPTPFPRSIAWTGTELVVAFSDPMQRQIVIQRFTPDASAIEMPIVIGPNGGELPSILWTGDRLAIEWFDASAAAIEVAELTADGTLIRQLSYPDSQLRLLGGIQANANAYVIAYEDGAFPNTTVEIGYVDRAAWTMTSTPTTPNVNGPTAIASTSDGTFATATMGNDGNGYVQAVDATGTPGTSMMVPPYGTDTAVTTGIAGDEAGFQAFGLSFTELWEVAYDPISGFGVPALRGSLTAPTQLAQPVAVTASGREAIAEAYSDALGGHARLIQTCP